MQGMLDGNQLPEHIDMEQMMGGMNAMGDNVPGIQGQDWDEYKVTALEPGDVGKTFDCSAGKRQMTKTLLVAGKYADFDNPTTLWVVRAARTRGQQSTARGAGALPRRSRARAPPRALPPSHAVARRRRFGTRAS